MTVIERLREALPAGDLTCTLCDRKAAVPLAGPWPQRFGAEAFAGEVRTVHAPAGELAAVDRALDDLRAGQVLVIASSMHAAIWGGRLTGRALQRRAAGVVVAGCVRDVPELRQAGLPLFAREVAPNRSDASGPGATDVPLLLGTATVGVGDLIVADANGIVVIPQERSEAVAAGLETWLARARQP